MKFNYQYIVSALEGYIKRNELDGTELGYLNMHKSAFESDYLEIMDLKSRWDKIEKQLKEIGQNECKEEL